MTDGEKHPIRNLIIFPVIAGLILAGLLYFIPKFLAFVLNTISTTWKYLLSKTFLPNSILLLLVILAIPTILNLAKYLFRNKVQQSSDEMSLETYKTDKFFGMVWRWSYIARGVPSADLWCFCPDCATRLVYSDSHTYMDRETVFICENCNFRSNIFKGSREHVLSRVARQIERKITTGEWKDIVKRPSNNSV